ncbi:restriction endonuclease subunit S [Azospirillum brasilense]|uniref:restriction endonuclease subunit S n=1 Tax=Azospirillum brasilense TaxID=192 RepID=UPI0011EF7167|nr:restriction endonuclease subunit S [Azospirillum brasilense]QEL98775.1 restriction endonuclease subunit S [Azospirillum brasilense]
MSYPRYAEYKESRIEWLGEVPKHWRTTPVKYMARFFSGGTPSKENEEYWGGEIPWVSAKDMKVDFLSDAEDHLTGYAVEQGAATLLDVGAVLIVVRGMILARTFPVTVTRTRMAINQDLKGIVAKANVLPDFVAWYLRGTAEESLRRLDEAGHGTKALRMDAWTSLPVAAPPLHEQSSIVAFLDRETGKIDALVAEQEKLIELLREKRQAVISHAVTKGLDPTVPMKDSGIEWLGAVPAHWEVKRLKFTIAGPEGLQMGPFGGMLLDLESENTGFKVYGQQNTISGNFEIGTRWINGERFRDLISYKLSPGDIVLTRKGSLGHAALVHGGISPGIIDSDTIRVRVNGGIVLPKFLTLLFVDALYVETQINVGKRGAILSGMNTDTVANLVLALPPRSEQEALLNCLDSSIGKLGSMTAEAQRAINLLKERRSALISAAVTGKIDVRALVEDEQPAKVLELA